MKKIYILILVLASCSVVQSKKETTKRELIHTEEKSMSKVKGFWLSEEYGWLLEVDEAGIKRRQYGEDYCYLSNKNEAGLMGSIEYKYVTFITDDIAKFEYLKSDGNTIYKRLLKLPAKCEGDLPTEFNSILDVYLSIFEEHYAFFENRGGTFESLKQIAIKKLEENKSESGLLEAMEAVITPLKDSHTKLYASIDGKKYKLQSGLGKTLPMIRESISEQTWLISLVDQTLNELLDDGAEHTANERIIWGTINGNTGYIKIFTMGGFTENHKPGTQEWADSELQYLDTLFEKIIARFEEVDSVVIDLSNNRGGYDAIARKLASYFTESTFDAYSVNTKYSDPYVYRVEPHPAIKYLGPIKLITSDVTVSGGEISTLTFKQLPNVTHYGQKTRGAFSTPLAKPLPNGWYLELSNEIFKSPQGVVFEGIGISPDYEIEIYNKNAPVESHKEAVLKIIGQSK